MRSSVRKIQAAKKEKSTRKLRIAFTGVEQ